MRNGLPTWCIVLIVAAIVGVGVGGFLFARTFVFSASGSKVASGQAVTVVIPEGSSSSSIVDILADAGVIRSKLAFKSVVRDQNAEQSLRCGSYTFITGSEPEDVVRQLVLGPNSGEGQLLIPEGLTITQTAALVQSSLGIPEQDFVNQAKAANYAKDFPFLKDAGNGSLEGYLYPKTYDFAGKEPTADTVIRLMLAQYQSEVPTSKLSDGIRLISERYKLNATAYDILKIASIIEKEAITAEDRPLVSSVFYNRLSIGMALQSDATMGYETGGAVTSDDLSVDSPYNTYLYKGLPPTPICSPSLWAIEAALDPADSEYYYFFIIESDNYSKHTFSKTYEEHDAAYRAALKEQAEAEGRPVPSESEVE